MNTRDAMILATGSYVPKQVLTNFDLEKKVDTTDEWIRERSGIERRHILEEGLTNSDMCLGASKAALEQAKMKPEELDAIIVGTITGDSPFPATACRLQAKLGAVNAACFDVSAACSGFLYGLSVADAYIKSGMYHKVLVIGSEVLSRITDWEDRSTCVLFGDAAGAAIVTPSDGKRKIVSTYIRSDGRLGDLLYMPAGLSSMPASHETVDKRLHFVKMAGREVYKYAVKAMADAAVHVLRDAGLSTAKEIDLLIPHQANIRIIETLADRIHLPREKVFITIQDYGNTSSSSVPLALDVARRTGVLKDGMRCMLVAFGGGFSWGASIIQF